MLLVLASKWDEQAAEFVRSCEDTRLLTPDDLSVAGWKFRSSCPEEGVTVAAGECIPTKEITGVYTKLPCVMPHELLQIAPNERDYVAAEMHAFLVAWLSTLRCPVVNRPTPGYLAGPAWGPERWMWEGARHGIPAAGLDRDSDFDSALPPAGSVITVMGKAILGTDEPQLRAYATLMAQIAKVTALTVHFEKGRLHFASSYIDIGNEAIRWALLNHFGMRCSKHDDLPVGVTG